MDADIRERLAARLYAEAFELVVRRYQDKVFRLAFSMLRNETQAEDTAQDVFVKIWKALPGYHGGAALSTWIYTITRNTCLTELKKRSIRPTVSLHELEMEAVTERIPALQSAAAEAGTEMDVCAMLAELSEKYRQVITLFYLEQKAYEEVAAMLGIPLGTVKTLLFRAKKELLRIASRRSIVPATTSNFSKAASQNPARPPTPLAGHDILPVPTLL
jgi:RNA polymerase sigma-70 factor (ECF subfamily)